MSELHDEFVEAFTKACVEHGVEEGKLEELSAEIFGELTVDVAETLRADLAQRRKAMLHEWAEIEEGFKRRNCVRWNDGFGLLRELWVTCEELGSNFDENFGVGALEPQDFQIEALVRLHSRALLISKEIICLLENGFPDGAMARWRSLHEATVIAWFLSVNDQETSLRFLRSFDVVAARALKQYFEYQDRANLTAVSETEVKSLQVISSRILSDHGKEMKNDYGWASKTLGIKRPFFSDIEKACELDHWRPRYRWASSYLHPGYIPIGNLLGVSESDQPVFLVGHSNSGMTDPAHQTAISLTLVTHALLDSRINLDTLAMKKLVIQMSDEVGEAFLRVQKMKPQR